MDHAPSDTNEGFSVTDVAGGIRSQIAEVDDGAAIRFEDLLSAAGFRWEDDYSDSKWIEGTSRLYRVGDQFPRITALTIMPGISNVKYSISTVACEPFHIEDDVLVSALGGRHGD